MKILPNLTSKSLFSNILTCIPCIHLMFFVLFIGTLELSNGLFFVSLFLGAQLALLSLIDLKWGILPDEMTLSLLASGLGVTWWLQAGVLIWHLLGVLIAGLLVVGVNLIYRRHSGVDGIGYGDAKLLAAAGAWVGLLALPSVLLCACTTSLIHMLLRAIHGEKLTGQSSLAFGPHLAFGLWWVWLFGPIGPFAERLKPVAGLGQF